MCRGLRRGGSPEQNGHQASGSSSFSNQFSLLYVQGYQYGVSSLIEGLRIPCSWWYQIEDVAAMSLTTPNLLHQISSAS